jgi:GH15 family glucan-1,4-alpha-glucosidase
MKPLYLPSAAIGNSLSLATFGPSGEIMGFFYPHIDFAQNVREGMFALHLPGRQKRDLAWCFSDPWTRRQQLAPDRNVLVTELLSSEQGLAVRVTDFLPPGEHALVRRFEVRREHPESEHRLYQYLKLDVGDVGPRNAVQLMPDKKVVLQQYQGIVLGVAASREFGIQCGIVGPAGASSVKKGMAASVLQGGDQCMGDVDFAIGFDLGIGAEWDVTLVLAGGRTREEAADHARRLSDVDYGALFHATQERAGSILAATTTCDQEEFARAYNRAVLSLLDLYDESAGTFIAAPEFDPGFRYSGGYGYCWPRDAAHSALVAAALGFADRARRFFEWCADTQLHDGHWYQRYWVEGTEGPSWCVRQHEIQLDQTCAVLHAAGRFAGMLGEEEAISFTRRFHPTAERAAQAIVRHVDENGLHKQSSDLWECSQGSFAYTNAAVVAALREAQAVFGMNVPDLGRIRALLLERLYDPEGNRWARRIDPEGRVDWTADSSCLGLIEPWGLLDLDHPEGRSLALKTLDFVERKLMRDINGGQAVLRFENESYMGGGTGCVNTLWLAQCDLKVAGVLAGEERASRINKAKVLLRTVLANTNPVGQLPELIPNTDGFAYWAAPHGWASALLIQCVHLLDALARDDRRTEATWERATPF